MIQKIEAMMLELVESHEFRSLLSMMVLKHFGAALSELDDEATKDTVTENIDTNLTPEGLGWHFRSKLSRPPNSQECIESCASQFKALLDKGVNPLKILAILKERGKNPEPIWQFLKRFDGEPDQKASGLQAALERVAATKKMIEERHACRNMPTEDE